MELNEYIKNNTLRCEISYRGGGIEIDLAELLKKSETGEEEDYLMTAYQNYLGGGMLGSIGNSYSFDVEKLSKKDQKTIAEITDAVNRYFHGLTNHEDDEWESSTYEQNQNRPESAY